MRTLKTAMLLTGLTLLLVLGGRAFAGPQGMTFGLIVAVGMNGFAYFFSDKIALKSSGAQPVTREQAPRLYAVMERLAAKGNLPMPKLYVIPQAAAQRLRHRPQPLARFGGRYRGLARAHDRRRA